MWSDDERQLLDGLLDQLVPANADKHIPGAGQAGVADFLGKVASQDSDLSRLLRSGLSSARVKSAEGLDHHALLQWFETEEPDFFTALLRQTYMGYYSRSDIRPLFGLSDLPTQPRGYDVPAESPELMTELTAPVVARGRCYRDV